MTSTPFTGEQSFIPSPTPLPSQTKASSTIETPGAIETSIPTEMLASSENFPLAYNLPEWMNNPEVAVGMTISEINGDVFKFAFLNFGTKDSFEISTSSNVVMGYFWIPDGTHFGFLSLDMQTVFLVNLESGQMEQIPIPEHAVRFLKGIEREKFVEPLIIHRTYPNDFTFLPLYHQDYSYDLRYIADYDFQNIGNRPVIVENIKTGQIAHITNPSDEFCNIEYMWSPDGSKILYGDESSNSPCILDLSLATKRCLREITRKHPNVNTINALHWSMDGKQIYYTYFNADESGLCVYNLINGDDFCPTDGLQELKDFDIVRYTVSPDERFWMFHFGGSCATCDYWDNSTVGVIGKDGSNFYTLGEELLVGMVTLP